MSGLVLDEHDVTELTTLLNLARDGEEGPVLPWPFLLRLKELIGCDDLTFTGMDSHQRDHYFMQEQFDGERSYVEHREQTESALPAADDPFWRHYWDCEPCSYPDRTADYASVTLQSDFYSQRRWHDTGMYLDVFRSDGIEHELMMCLPDGAGRSVRLLCFRSAGSDFGERERFLLTLLRPHVAEAYRAAVRRRTSPAPLTPRQLEILDLVRTGLTNTQIGRRLGVSEGTVRTHLTNIFTRLDVTSRTAAVTKGLAAGA